MKSKRKLLIIITFFIFIVPSVQANVFDDIKSINREIQNANKKLVSIQAGIDDLNNKTQEVSDTILLIKDTNQGIQEMDNKLDSISNKLTDALGKTEKVDDYVGDIKMLMTVGITVIILAIITLIGSTFVITRRKK